MLLRSLILSALALTLSACNLSGTAEKGPFKASANVSLAKLNNQANPIASNTLNTNIYANNGAYSFSNIQWDGWGQLQVNGQYFNEFTASTSANPLTLDAITRKDRTFDTANIHIFSHLAAARIRQRVANGQNRVRAWKNTQTEMKQLFGLQRVSRNIHRGVEQLSLQRGSGQFRKDNANLLLFTGSFLSVAGDAASLALLTNDFANDGQFNGVGASLFNTIAATAASDGLLASLSNNLRAYGVGNPPNNGDMQQLPIWVNQNVADNIAPVVTVDGSNPVTIVVGTPYDDEGASATDNIDGVVTAVAVNGSDVINTANIGTHSVSYSATDIAGNTGTATRIVNVVEAPDTEDPVITLLGDNPEILEVMTGEVTFPYQDPGYTVTDNRDQTILVDVAGSVDTGILGDYTLTYSAADIAGNSVTIDRTVTVVDTTNPVITLNGASAVEVVAGTAYNEQGASVSDNYYDDITVDISGAVNTDVVDTYTITYTAVDGSNNTATAKTRTVTVTEAPDTIAPVISLEGDASVTVEAGIVYTDAGATATDNKDGNLNNAIVVGGSVNIQVPANYVLTYNVQDSATNAADEITRTVIVVDTIAPVITLVGESTISLVEGSDYTDAGATAADSLDGNISDNIVKGGDTVDATTPGIYTITYNVMDNAQNSAPEVTRTVTITEAPDTIAPVITLLGEANIVVEAGTTYTDEGATAEDNKEGNLTNDITTSPANGTVDASTLGRTVIRYNVSDSVPNAADEVIRTVTVSDTTKPEITLIGDAQLVIQKGDNYIDAGATASDSFEGVLTSDILVDNLVDSSTPGTYTVTYSVSDNSLNIADTVTRTVRVNAPPSANAGDDVSVITSTSVDLVGSGSDTDGAGTVTYQWMRGQDVLSTSASYSYTPDNTETLTFVVTDSDGAVTSDTVNVEVTLPAAYQIVFVSDTTTVPRNLNANLFAQGLVVMTSVIDGNGATVANAVPTFDVTAVDLSTPATYSVLFSYTDPYGRTITKTLTVIVENHAPIATSGNLTVDEDSINNPIELIASDSDRGDTLTYSVTQPANGTVAGTGKDVTYTPNPNFSGSDNFTFTASDGIAESTGTISITVTEAAPNVLPTANAGADLIVRKPATITLNGSGDDTDGSIVSYRWTSAQGNFEYATTPSFDLDSSNKYAGDLYLKLTVTDNDGASASDLVKVTILPALDSPAEMTLSFISPLQIDTGTYANEQAFYDYLKTQISVIDHAGNVHDNDTSDHNDGKYYQFGIEGYSGAIGSDSDGWDSFDPTTAGIGEVTVNYTNIYGDGIYDLDIDVVINQQQNPPPTANASSATTTITLGDTTTLDASASSDNGSIDSYVWSEGGFEIGTGVTISYTPDSAGTHTVTLIVTDNEGAIDTDTVVIEVTSINNNPRANAGRDKTAVVNSRVRISGSGTDSDGDSITGYKWTDASGTTRSTFANWEYIPATVGDHELTLTVTDSRGGTGSDSVIVHVTAPVLNVPPTADAGDDTTVAINSQVTLSGLSTDGDGTIEEYKWTEAGNVLHTSSHDGFSYQPTGTTSLGVHTITLTVTDDDGATATDDVKVTVTEEVIVSAACRATPATERDFTDHFIINKIDDRPWPSNLNSVELTVVNIADVFNRARLYGDSDAVQGKKLVMPTQAEWNTYSNSQKALYLINSERCARGILPYEGVSPEVVSSPAQTYAELLALNNVFSHTADGRDPWIRLTQDANVIAPTQTNPNPLLQNADFFGRAENLAYRGSGASTSYPIVYNPVVKAVYGWIYDDKDDTKVAGSDPAVYTYGHREFILARGLEENSGESNKEGLIGIGVAVNEARDESGQQLFWTKAYTVMNGFDPNGAWDMSNIETVPLIESDQCLNYHSFSNVVNMCIPLMLQ